MMSTCSREAALFTKACSFRLGLAYFAEKYLKIDWSVKSRCIGSLWELQAPSNGLLIKFSTHERVLYTVSANDIINRTLQCILVFIFVADQKNIQLSHSKSRH